ncbi:hypothetical protein [Streptomyces brasiliensis]|uniref:Uncharacterized protein n=1 Tax=Streptomyces brasiliensis TaxID=1954 RepID=A0A917P656_9ACTN|nr:hypothetical protein [Streptomyces brasiliensis]GGJ63266.1 hypothetical protein GCM10010121_087420 [Streptomyces brasiliensis]
MFLSWRGEGATAVQGAADNHFLAATIAVSSSTAVLAAMVEGQGVEFLGGRTHGPLTSLV